MEIFQQEVGEIIKGITTDDIEKVEMASQVLSQLNYEYNVNNGVSGFDKDAYSNYKQEFDDLDGRLHAIAHSMSEDARRGDRVKLLEDFKKILSTCVECHEKFRSEASGSEPAVSSYEDKVQEAASADSSG
jgi:cytochrome c556